MTVKLIRRREEPFSSDLEQRLVGTRHARYHFCERSCVMSLSPKQQQQQHHQNQTSFTVHDILDEDAYARRGLVVGGGGSATELFYCPSQYPPQAVSPPVGLMNPMGQMNGAMTSPYHGYVHHQLTGHHHHHHPSAAASFATQYCPGSELTHYNSANPMQGVRNSTTSPWYAGSDPRLTSKYNIQAYIYQDSLNNCVPYTNLIDSELSIFCFVTFSVHPTYVL